MKVLVALEYHFLRCPRGQYFAKGNYGYEFWKRYLEVFDDVLIVARVTAVQEVQEDWLLVEGPSVELRPMPDFRGPMQYLPVRGRANRIAKQVIRDADRFILRVPGTISSLIERKLRAAGHGYAVEVVGDPWEALAPRALRSIFRPLARRIMTSQMRRQCQEAYATTYVTAESLQRRYPPSEKGYSTSFSDIVLPEEAFAAEPRQFHQVDADRLKDSGRTNYVHRWRLIFVGSLSNYHKGLDVLLVAIWQCHHLGIDLELKVLGDGRYRHEYARQVGELGIRGLVTFLGHVADGRKVRDHLRNSDLFVLPSRTEGLPRAMVEAMALGLPCIGSRVGGMRELLLPEELVEPDDASALKEKIAEILSNPNRMNLMSLRNLRIAWEFREEALNVKRTEFYRIVRENC